MGVMTNWKEKFRVGKIFSFGNAPDAGYTYECQGNNNKGYPIFEYIHRGIHGGTVVCITDHLTLGKGKEIIPPVKHTWNLAIYRLRDTGKIGCEKTTYSKEQLEKNWANAEVLELRTIEFIEKK